mgnify:CR=1 FL=1
MSYTRIKFEQTHIIRPASCGTFRRFAQTFLKRQPSQFLFWRTSPLCDTNAVYTQKPLLSSHFSVFCRNKFNFHFVFERPGTCSHLSTKYLIFLFCTFLFINPLCNLSIFTLVPGSVTFAPPCRKKRPPHKMLCSSPVLSYRMLTRPDNPAAALHGWGGAACAAPLLRSDAPAPGSH